MKKPNVSASGEWKDERERSQALTWLDEMGIGFAEPVEDRKSRTSVENEPANLEDVA